MLRLAAETVTSVSAAVNSSSSPIASTSLLLLLIPSFCLLFLPPLLLYILLSRPPLVSLSALQYLCQPSAEWAVCWVHARVCACQRERACVLQPPDPRAAATEMDGVCSPHSFCFLSISSPLIIFNHFSSIHPLHSPPPKPFLWFASYNLTIFCSNSLPKLSLKEKKKGIHRPSPAVFRLLSRHLAALSSVALHWREAASPSFQTQPHMTGAERRTTVTTD